MSIIVTSSPPLVKLAERLLVTDLNLPPSSPSSLSPSSALFRKSKKSEQSPLTPSSASLPSSLLRCWR
ncbi:hypothetical protein Bca4012_064371 [Brassica carinata]|uniref:Uncharacterized protein n=1 Tax=Brassica carinata TaxID=52824 RepID=A0A8X7SFK1_BRACI|nr:hypothetical protein Bca52824_033959 [Brassica carinata]